MGRAEVHNDESNFKAYKKIQMKVVCFCSMCLLFCFGFSQVAIV